LEGWDEEASHKKVMALRDETIRLRDAWREADAAWIEQVDQHYRLKKAKDKAPE
jgi:hypothetical protein